MRLLAAAALLFAIAPTVHAAEDRVAKTVALTPGMPIVLNATMADLTIEGTARDDASVQIIRRAPSDEDLAKYPAEIEERDGALRITALQEADGRDPALKSEIRLSVPAVAVLQQIRVFEGRIRVSNVRGSCDIAVQRGTIDATAVAGRVRLETELGSIDVKGAELTPGGMMRLRAFNGDVRIRFGQKPESGRVLAVTYNGTIASDIPLATKDKFGPHFGETTLGSGDPVMSIDVVKGNIEIRVK